MLTKISLDGRRDVDKNIFFENFNPWEGRRDADKNILSKKFKPWEGRPSPWGRRAR